MKTQLSFIVALTFSMFYATAQPVIEFPEIGKPCPNFVLHDVTNYTSKRLTLEDLKGKYTILDFWNRGCLACINSFPKVNQMHKRFKEKLTIVVVGEEDKENMIRPLFARLKEKNKYEFVAAFDSTIVNRMVHRFFPHYVWINQEGIIEAVTGPDAFTSENIEKFVSGKAFSFVDASYRGYKKNREQFTNSQALLVDPQYCFKSELIKWQHGMPRRSNYNISIVNFDQHKNAHFSTYFTSVGDLYRMAYWGSVIPSGLDEFEDIVLEIKDSTDFIPSTVGASNGYYIYSLSCLAEQYSEEKMKFMMQKDLEKFFPYQAQIEDRRMPCYELRIVDSKKLSLLNPVKKNLRSRWGNTGGLLIETPIEKAVISVARYLPNNYRVINKTGITGNVNLVLTADLWDIECLKLKLKDQGLDLILTERTMKTLVIKDLDRKL